MDEEVEEVEKREPLSEGEDPADRDVDCEVWDRCLEALEGRWACGDGWKDSKGLRKLAGAMAMG